MPSSSSLAAVVQPAWSATSPRPTRTLQDRAMDEDKLLKQQGSGHPDDTTPGLPSSASSPSLSIPNPPMFGSTSHKLGMNTEMAILNHNLHKQYTEDIERLLLDLIHQPFEAKLPNPVKSTQYLRPKSLLQAISELPEKLLEDDEACRRISKTTPYWTSEHEHDLWQQTLVKQLVRAEHAQLDEKQNPLFRYARQLVRAEEVELWYRQRELAKLHKKQRKRRSQLRRHLLAIKKRAEEDGDEELLRKIARLPTNLTYL
ncbi:hypothetical protein F4776DRAFT_122375 [Hypoxylon sp. NC0597]|nr:hypothetical protein F4776DRAFT_122375 [Hypoxylon sp. NC0597]